MDERDHCVERRLRMIRLSRSNASERTDMAEDRGGERRGALVIHRLPYDPVSWETIVERYPDAEVFHSSAWLAFLTASQGAEPVVAVVREGERPVGHFVGAIVRRFGVRILGSPLSGWGTQSMGFLLEEGSDRRAAAEALVPFAFRDLGCLNVELGDRWLTAEEMAGSGYRIETGRTFVLDLTSPEEVIFGRMRRSTRRYIHQAVRQGVRAEVTSDIAFADEYHGQLRDVFAQDGLVPTYGVERVRQLIKAVQPTGQLLLLRVRAPDGALLATGLFVGRNRTAVAWGAGFLRANAGFHPNELLHWEAMRYWRARGAARYDMSGGGDYKAKYGGIETPTVRFHRSRYAGLEYGREAVRHLVNARQIVAGLGNRPVAPGAEGRSPHGSGSADTRRSNVRQPDADRPPRDAHAAG
jgi:hypothetical protein